MTVRRTLALAGLIGAALMLQGCLAGAVVGTAVGVTGAVVGTTVGVTGAVVGAGVDQVTTSREERRENAERDDDR